MEPALTLRGFKSNKVQPRESLDSGECNIRHTIRKYLARKVNDRTIIRQTLALVYGYCIGQNERKESEVDIVFFMTMNALHSLNNTQHNKKKKNVILARTKHFPRLLWSCDQ